MKRFLLLAAFLVMLSWFVPARGAEFKINEHTFTVPDGFQIELAAGPPLVKRPIEADFDEQGRLYVTDSSGSNDKTQKQLAEKPHRVVRIEDTDGDGRFDKTVVFADKMMFPEGCMWFDGSLYVAAPPSIWKLTDSDGDGMADKREEWHKGQTLTGCANDLHGPYLGPDGWIYWCKGAFAEQTYTLDNGETFKTRASHIFRKRPDGTGLEAVMTGGMDNPVGVAFLPNGERFFTTTFVHQPQAGKRDGLVHAIYGGVYGKVNDAVNGHKRTGDLMPVMVQWGPSAPCGLARYESRVFGADYQDNLFACLFNLRKVTRHELTPDGATYKSRETDFVTSDNPDFHPTDVLEDADGSLLVIDTGGWYKLCCPTSQLAKPDVLGAIYRVRRKGAPRLEDPLGLKVAWNRLRPADFPAILTDARPVVRRRAIREFARRGSAALAAAGDKSWPRGDELACNTIWAAGQMDGPSARTFIRTSLQNSSPLVRKTAVYNAGLRRDPEAVSSLVAMLQTDSAPVKRAAAEALGRIGERRAVSPLLASMESLTSGPEFDRVLEHSLIFALIEIGDRDALQAELAASGTAREGSPALKRLRAALIALDQMDKGGLGPDQVIPLLSSTDDALKQAAQWVVSHHAEWGEALAGFFQQRLRDSGLNGVDRVEFQRQLSQFARNNAIQELLARAARETGTSTRLTALGAMAASGLKEAPAAWTEAIINSLAAKNPPVVRQAVATAKALPPAKGGGAEVNAALMRVGRDPEAPAEVRLDALAALAGGAPRLEPDLFVLLRDNLDPTRPVGIRSAACAALAKSKLNAEQLNALAETLKTVGPIELPKLLPAFDNSGNEALGLKLVESLRQSKGVSSLRADVLKPRLTNFPAVVQQKGEELLASLNTDAAKEKAHLEALLGELNGGDIRRGQVVFNSAKAACSSCHAIGYLGGNIGPDLTSIGQVRTERDLLEAILYPSASFVRSYEPIVVVTKSGDDYSGVLRKDATDEIVLATGVNAEVRLARSDIAEMRPGAVSVMPQGLDVQLSRQELADLLAFLKNTKWGPQ